MAGYYTASAAVIDIGIKFLGQKNIMGLILMSLVTIITYYTHRWCIILVRLKKPEKAGNEAGIFCTSRIVSRMPKNPRLTALINLFAHLSGSVWDFMEKFDFNYFTAHF